MGCSQAKIEPETLTPDDARIIRETWKMVGREAYGEYGQRLMLRYVLSFFFSTTLNSERKTQPSKMI